MSWIFVAMGGAIGACARYGLGLAFKPQPGELPLATLTANVLGCFLMGVLFVVIVDRHWLPETLRPALMVGFLGALTTFSSFAIEALGLWQTHHSALAVGYVVLSIILCLCAVWLGYNLTEWVANSVTSP